MYNDELMHAATRIMANRAEQLGISEDELMHYGRKGMKWGENIFENTINNPNINPFKKRELEKKKEELLTRPVRIERGAQVRGDTGTSQDMSGYDRALGEGKKVFVGNDYLDGKPVKDNYLQKADPEPGTRINYRYDYTSENHKSPDDRAKQNTNIQKYGNTVNSYQAPTAEDTARGQAVREEQKRARQEELNKKKQELLNKAKEERIMRERYANRAKYTK